MIVEVLCLCVEIIPSCKNHINEILVIEKLCFSIPWSKQSFNEEIVENKLAYYFSAVYKGRIVGYAGIWMIFDEGHITNLAVHPECRKRGIGKKLLGILSNKCVDCEVNKMTLEVRVSNISAQKLYINSGFVTIGSRKNYYPDNGEDALIMWKYGLTKELKL